MNIPVIRPVPGKLDPAKFRDPARTAKGETRASIVLDELRTLWFNTGTLCNIECAHCYIESSPRNDRLEYLALPDIRKFLDEVVSLGWRVREIGFTGGEPFMNPDIIAMLDLALSRGFDVLVLTNAMKPMMRFTRELKVIRARFGDRLTLRVSLDHHSAAIHDQERGSGSFAKSIEGLDWLSREKFRLALAARHFTDESEEEMRLGFAKLAAERAWPIDTSDPANLVIFPEMDPDVDVPEITTSCWKILGKSPGDVMCASSRMVVKRKGAAAASVVSCTLLPYDSQFELGTTLAGARGPVPLNHPHCARFCVLGGASCSAGS